MHFTPAVVIAARFANETGAPVESAAAGFPAAAGPFKLYGCVQDRSTAGFQLVASSEAMNANLCAASCPTAFMGIAGKDCLCGEALDEALAPKVAMEACSTSMTAVRRQDTNIDSFNSDNSDSSGSNNNIMTYRRDETNILSNTDASNVSPTDSDGNGIGNGNGDGDGNGNGAGIGNKGNGIGNTFGNQIQVVNNYNQKGQPYPTPAPTTVTETITSTTTGTITTCAPEYPDCPVSYTTHEIVITTTYCPEPTPYYPEPCYGEHCGIDYEWYSKKLTCYGGYCAPEYPCQDCDQYRVVCEDDYCYPEVCDAEHVDDYNRLVICSGDDCHYDECYGEECQKKVTCYDDVCIPEQCYGEECQTKFVCYDDIQCGHEECYGDDCYTRQACYGNECEIIEPCSGSECPIPAPPTNVPVTIGSTGSSSSTGSVGTSVVSPPSTIYPGTEGKGGPVVPVGASSKALPAFGFTLLGAAAGFAFLL